VERRRLIQHPASCGPFGAPWLIGVAVRESSAEGTLGHGVEGAVALVIRRSLKREVCVAGDQLGAPAAVGAWSTVGVEERFTVVSMLQVQDS
jgi:hypothetical protein